MNIWLVSPAWRRFAVTRLALAERRWLCDELAARGHTACSVIVADDENLEIAEEFGFDRLEMSNDDLGAKFNGGYRYAAEQGAELLVHVGSDDWVHPGVFNILEQMDLSRPPPLDLEGGFAMWREGPTVVSQRKATVVHLESGQVQRCSVRGSHGCIPWLIPREALAPVGFQPIRLGLMRGMDGALVRGLRPRPNWKYQEAEDDWLVDWKTDENLTPYELLVAGLGVGEKRSTRVLRDSYPDYLVDMAESIQMQEGRDGSV